MITELLVRLPTVCFCLYGIWFLVNLFATRAVVLPSLPFEDGDLGSNNYFLIISLWLCTLLLISDQDLFIFCKHNARNNGIIWFWTFLFSLRIFKSNGSTGFEIILLFNVHFIVDYINPVFLFSFQRKHQDLFDACELSCSIKISLTCI